MPRGSDVTGMSARARPCQTRPVPVKRASLPVGRVKDQEKVLSLLASRMDLVEKRVAGQEPRVDGQELDLSLPSFFLKLQVGRMELLAPDLELLAERVELLVRDLDGHTHFLERHSISMDRQSRTTAGRSETTAGRSRKRFRCSKNVTRRSERRVRWQKRCGVDFRCRTVPIPGLPRCREHLRRVSRRRQRHGRGAEGARSGSAAFRVPAGSEARNPRPARLIHSSPRRGHGSPLTAASPRPR